MKELIWHARTPREILSELDGREHGLHEDEVRKRLVHHGKNVLPRTKQVHWWEVLWAQFTSPLILILIGSSILSAFLGDAVDVLVILAAVGLNAVVGFIQEYKANQALEKLRSLVQPQTTVRRAGKDVQIPAADVVPGDILVLAVGDQVSADARVLDSNDLEINEAPLTGESSSVMKKEGVLSTGTILAERTNMVYAGTSVVGGRGTAIVVATGAKTELGVIAALVSEAEEEHTPLQRELSVLARWLSGVVMVLIIFTFVVGVARGHSAFEMLQTSIALAVAAVPEGLAVSVTVVLAIGMQRILARKALVRRLIAAETLGSVSVICTDKTGTITEGQMRVRSVILSGRSVAVNDPLDEVLIGDRLALFEAMLLCNDASIEDGQVVRATPTERALAEAAIFFGLDASALRARAPRVREISFDSSRKYMATVHRYGHERGAELFVKGAPEKVFAMLSHHREHGKRLKWDAETSRAFHRRVSEMAEQGLRLIAVARRELMQVPDSLHPDDLQDLELLGLVALQDPLRSTSREQIRAAAAAGVHTVLITGDHPKTALAIGEEAGLLTRDGEVTIGSDLDSWTDAELAKRVTSIVVYARVEPRHKLRIVNAWRERGAVVAMTGDGVNDAPALKAADVGVALGSGTDVAKQASDLVLLDNNLGTITAAIEEGRVIFDNIRKSLVYLMADAFREIILIVGALAMGLPVPLLPVQILWINLVADSLPNAGLIMEPGEDGIMSRPPRKRNEPVLNREMFVLIFIIGVVTDLFLFALYLWYLRASGDSDHARTVIFAAVGIGSLLYVFSLKSFHRSILQINPFSNPWLIAGVLGGAILLAIPFVTPGLREVFQLTPIGLSDVALLLIIGLLKLVAIEAAKVYFNRRKDGA